MMKTSVALLLLLFLPSLVYCRSAPPAQHEHRKGWGSRLDLKEKTVQQFLKHKGEGGASKSSTEFDSSGYYHDFGDYDDNEDGDVTDEDEPRLQRKEKSGCVHPKTHNTIAIGSFDFDEKSCMVCECPAGKLNCYKTC